VFQSLESALAHVVMAYHVPSEKGMTVSTMNVMPEPWSAEDRHSTADASNCIDRDISDFVGDCAQSCERRSIGQSDAVN
jgi:hypothetical protein